jgi:hypothetical protein
MTLLNRILLFFVLPIIAFLSYPPGMLAGNISVGTITLIGLVVVFFIGLGFLLQNGRAWVLTLAIFLQGLNVIIRLMMLAPNSFDLASQTFDWPYIVTNLFGLVLSFYLTLRLDQTDIRVQMAT